MRGGNRTSRGDMGQCDDRTARESVVGTGEAAKVDQCGRPRSPAD